jgi:DNA repair protein RadC
MIKKSRYPDPYSVFRVMRRILLRENEIEREQEHVWIIGLAANSTILHIELVGLGNIDQVLIKPMQVFRVALIKGAVAVILVHNHPSRELTPSKNDLDLTDRMIQVGKIIQVEVFDHLIISTENCLSFKVVGLIDELDRSKKWVPPFVEEERLRNEKDKLRKEAIKTGKKEGIKEGKKIGKQMGLEKGIKKGRKEEKQEMAKKLKKKGIDTDIIAETSGLSKEEIERL